MTPIIQVEVRYFYADGSEASKKSTQLFRVIPSGAAIATAGGIATRGMAFDVNKAAVDEAIEELKNAIQMLEELKNKHGSEVPGLRLEVPVMGGVNVPKKGPGDK